MTAKAREPRWRHVASAALAIAVVVAVFGFALPKFASYGAAWHSIAKMSAWQVAILAVLALARLAEVPWQMIAGLPGLRFRPAFVANAWSTAMSNTVPAGGALAVGVTYEMLIAAGCTLAAITREFVVTGIWNTLVKLALPLAAVFALAAVGDATGEVLHLAVVGVGVFAAVLGLLVAILESKRAARRVGDLAARVASRVLRLARREPVAGWGERLVAFDEETGSLLRERWFQLTASTLAGELTLFALLLLCLRFVGVTHHQVNGAEVFAAYVIGRLLQVVPITPGGIGVVQLGLAGTLASFGAPRSAASAATLVYTALTWLPPVPIGIVAFAGWRRRHRDHASPAPATS